MLDALKFPHWERTFHFGLSPGPRVGSDSDDPSLRKPFTREDVSKIIALRRGDKESSPGWVCVCRLNDKRYAFIYNATQEGDSGKPSGYGWSYTSLSLVRLLTIHIRNDFLEDLVRDVRKLAHGDGIENDTKLEIVELALRGSKTDA